MKDDIVRSLLGILLIAVTIGLFVQFVWIRSAKKENIALKSELVVLEDQDPDKNKKEPETVQSILKGRPPHERLLWAMYVVAKKEQRIREAEEKVGMVAEE